MASPLYELLLLLGILFIQGGLSFSQDAPEPLSQGDGHYGRAGFRPPPMIKDVEVGDVLSEVYKELGLSRPPPGFGWNGELEAISEYGNLTEADIKLKPGHPLERQAGNVLPCGTRTLARGYYYMQSPNYPKNYPNRYLCSSHLNPPAHFVQASVSLTCDRRHFDLESSSGCHNDYLSVFYRKYCSTSPPPVMRDYVFLLTTFSTNSAVTRPGFRCLVEVRDNGAGRDTACGFYYRLRPGSTHTISSINYPRNYENYKFCRWYFGTSSRSDQISISCSRFSLESHSSCEYDYLSINGRRYCGTTAPRVTRAAAMSVFFSSDFSVTSGGFSCTVSVTSGSSGCRCGMKNRRARVVGGQNTNSGEYPWMAGLVVRGGTRTFCGGSLINNRYVLTAAHCLLFSTTANTEVLLGDHRIGVSDGESRHSLSRIIRHPSYRDITSGWDFSLLRLSAPVSFTTRRRPICLPTAGQTYAGITAIATGWGRTAATQPQATILQEVSLPVLSEAQCRRRWGFINNSHICAGGLPEGGKAVCQGDSGGPLIAMERGRYAVIGVASFARLCAFPNWPDGFGRVTAALGWIRDNTRDATYCN